MFLEMAGGSVFRAISDLKDFPRIWNPYALENANVQKFIHSTGLHFDLVINEEFFADSFLMFAHKFKAPVVTICEFLWDILLFCNFFFHFSVHFLCVNLSYLHEYRLLFIYTFHFYISPFIGGLLCILGPFGSPDFVDRQQGLLTPLSFVPHWAMPFSDNMSFYERWFNTIVSVYDWTLRTFAFLPTEEEYARKYFGHLAPLPSLNDLHKNVSIILVNTHRALSPPRPSLPSKLGLK